MPRKPAVTKMRYSLIRNITSDDEKLVDVQSHIVNLPILEILKLGTDANLRDYIPGSVNGTRKTTAVHRAIVNTLMDEPSRFIVRNSGFMITSSDIKINESDRTVTLTNASVFNGAQSQGSVLEWAKEFYEDHEYRALLNTFFKDGKACGIDYDFDPNESPLQVRAQIIVDPDPEQVVLTAIARNTSTQVKSVSQAGAHRYLDDLQKSMASINVNIQMSETDDGVDTREVLQKAFLLMPHVDNGGFRTWDRNMPHGNAEKCLTHFMSWARDRHIDPESKRKYDFVVQMAPVAYQEYARWDSHYEWNTFRLSEEAFKGKLCKRDERGKIRWVARALVFPLVSALDNFVTYDEDTHKWSLRYPSEFIEKEHLKIVVDQIREIKDLVRMARSSSVYSAAANGTRAAAHQEKVVEEAVAKAVAEALAKAGVKPAA